MIRLDQRWRERSLTALLIAQVLTIFGLVPLAATGLRLPAAVGGFFLLLAMTFAVSLVRGRLSRAVGLLMICLTLLDAAVQLVGAGPGLRAVGDALALTGFLLLSIVVFEAVFGPGRITGHRVRGAVVFYLNIGLLFAFAHRIVAGLVPGAYDHLPPGTDTTGFIAALDYFSFTTLTTVGYGDIVPVHPIARSLCILEATLGQLLPTVLIARVVGMAMQDRQENKDRDGSGANGNAPGRS